MTRHFGDPFLRVTNPTMARTSCVTMGGAGKVTSGGNHFTLWLPVSPFIKKNEGNGLDQGWQSMQLWLMDQIQPLCPTPKFQVIFTYLNVKANKE